MPLYKRAIFLLLALCVAFAPLLVDAPPGEAARKTAPCHETACAQAGHGYSLSPCAESVQEMPSHDCCVSFAAIVPSASQSDELRASRENIAFIPARPLAARPADIYRPPWRA